MTANHFDPVRHEYRSNSVKVPHITAILKLVQPDVSFYTEEGRERGSKVHEAIKSGFWMSMENDPINGYISAWNKFIKDHAYKSILAEVPLWHPSGWAGTPDQYGTMDDDMRVVFEIKTGANHPSHALQTAAQAELIRVNGHKAPKLRFTLQLCADASYKIVTHKEHSDYAVFLSLLQVYRFKQRHNLLNQ